MAGECLKWQWKSKWRKEWAKLKMATVKEQEKSMQNCAVFQQTEKKRQVKYDVSA